MAAGTGAIGAGEGSRGTVSGMIKETAVLGRVARDSARAGSDVLVVGRARAAQTRETKSSPSDFVSASDRDSESAVMDSILKFRSSDGFIGEEGGSRESATGIYWVIDPLDGTTNYLYGRRDYSVSVAAIEAGSLDAAKRLGGTILVGVVSAPALGDVYEASFAGPALRNGKAIAVGEMREVGASLVGTGFSYDVGQRSAQVGVLSQVISRVGDVRRSGSAALDLCAVASGALDAYYEGPVHSWDIAAGLLILRRAGGRAGGTWDEASGTFDVRASGAELWESFNELMDAAASQ